MVLAQSQNMPGESEGCDIRSYCKWPVYMLKFKPGTLLINIVSATHGPWLPINTKSNLHFCLVCMLVCICFCACKLKLSILQSLVLMYILPQLLM